MQLYISGYHYTRSVILSPRKKNTSFAIICVCSCRACVNISKRYRSTARNTGFVSTDVVPITLILPIVRWLRIRWIFRARLTCPNVNKTRLLKLWDRVLRAALLYWIARSSSRSSHLTTEPNFIYKLNSRIKMSLALRYIPSTQNECHVATGEVTPFICVTRYLRNAESEPCRQSRV